MKNIDQLIEQIHHDGRQRLRNESGHKHRHLAPWHYAAAAVIAVAVILTVIKLATPAPLDANAVVAKNEKNSSTFSNSKDGIRVYCEDNCNADEVLKRFMTVVGSLD